MAAAPQPENKKTIEAVLLSVEARQFWERVYIACIGSQRQLPNGYSYPTAADAALDAWRERFDPKAGE